MSDSQSSTATTNLSTTTTTTTTKEQHIEQKQQQQQLDKVNLFREVESKKGHSICELSSSSPSTSSQLSTYKLIDANVNQLDSIRKLTGPHLKYFNTELNNNTIAATTFDSSNTYSSFKTMDSKQRRATEINNEKSTGSVLNQPGSAVINLNNKEESQQQQTIPSYSSIFAPSSYRNSLSSQHQIATQQQQNNQAGVGRLPLRKQIATADPDSKILNKQNNSGNRLGAFSYTSDKCSENQHDNDDDEAGDNEMDERLPFNSNMTKFCTNNDNKASPDIGLGCKSPNGNKHQNVSPTYDHRCYNKSSKNPQTKISFEETRPSLFNLCQASYNNHHDIMYPNLRSEQICSKCDCSNCCMKRKFILMDECEKSADINNSSYNNRKYARTRSLHLALKSIILVLLTLLLMILLVGIILATHYLPQVFDRVLNVSRSFNVTIAG